MPTSPIVYVEDTRPTFHWGNGVPSSGLGVDGDAYMDLAASMLYGPKANGSWGAGTSFQGLPGVDGADGADGSIGATGPAGPENFTICDSDTRPDPFDGELIFENDTSRLLVYRVSEWIPLVGGAFTSYTPGTTNLTLGNGTLTGGWLREGDMVTAKVELTFGSTTAITGTLGLNFPSAFTRDTTFATEMGSGAAVDASTSARHSLTWSGTSFYADGAVVNGSGPLTWATGDVVRGVMRAAIT